MANTLKQLIDYSKANPNSDVAINTARLIKEGSFDKQAQQEGIDLSWAGRTPKPVETEIPERNIVQKGVGLFLDPIAKLATETGNLAGKGIVKGVEMFQSPEQKAETEKKLQAALNKSSVVPGLGTEVKGLNKVTAKDVGGQVLGVAGLATGNPMLGGAALGAGQAMEDDAGLGGITVGAIGGALAGKVLEVGFKAVAPTIEKAIQKYGMPMFEKLQSHIPESVKGAYQAMAEKVKLPEIPGVQKVQDMASNIEDKITGAVKGGVEKVSEKLGITSTPEQKALNAITPKTKDLTPTEYEDLLARKKVTPKTASKPSEYILSEQEKATAKKYQNILQDTDPVKNSTNLINEISNKDAQVGEFLDKNNSIFNSGELKNFVSEKLKNISDVTIPETRTSKLKKQIIDNFISDLPKNDMKSLWKGRKAFDKKIESAFSGSPTLQNQVKKEFRNAVQDFISERTPEGVYKQAMKDMTELFNLNDTVMTKATKEKGLNAIQAWMKANPNKAKVIGWTAGGLVGNEVLKATTGIGF